MGKYDSIINMEHHVSKKHPHMSMTDRGAQFSPFAALTGYEDIIAETSRSTETAGELDEGEKERLGGLLDRALRTGAEAEILYFVPDAKKAGGSYASARGTVTKIDAYDRAVYLGRNIRIKLDDIIGVELESWEGEDL